jgi:hypothetical protein
VVLFHIAEHIVLLLQHHTLALALSLRLINQVRSNLMDA